MAPTLLESLHKHFSSYLLWLKKQSFSVHTKRAYKTRVEQYLVFLASESNDYSNVLTDANLRAQALSEYARYLLRSVHAKPNSINASLTAIDSFHQFFGLETIKIAHIELEEEAPKMLNLSEQRRFVHALDKVKSAKNRALALVFLYTGIRVSECVALNVSDVIFESPKSRIVVKGKKGERARALVLNQPVAEALAEWVMERKERFAKSKDPAVFVNPRGKRITATGIYLIIQEIGRMIDLDVSPYILRHTCLNNLITSGNDLKLVSGHAGHKRVRTTRKYASAKRTDNNPQ